MASALTNINMQTLTTCNSISYGASNVKEVWFGSNLLWEAPTSTESWFTLVSGSSYFVKQVFANSIQINNWSMYFSIQVGEWSYQWGIYQIISGSLTPITGAYGANTTGKSTTNMGTYLTETKWKHTTTLTTPVTLSAGTYYFIIQNNYQDYKILTGNNDIIVTDGWRLPSSIGTYFTTPATPKLKLDLNT